LTFATIRSSSSWNFQLPIHALTVSNTGTWALTYHHPVGGTLSTAPKQFAKSIRGSGQLSIPESKRIMTLLLLVPAWRLWRKVGAEKRESISVCVYCLLKTSATTAIN
jgi:hypothetical protein